MSWMRVKNIRLEGGPATTGTATISYELDNTWKDTYDQVKLLIYADLDNYSSIDINRAALVFSKTYANVGPYQTIKDTATVDLSPLKGKAVQLGYLLWVDGYYDGGNVPHTFAKPLYVCTGNALGADVVVKKNGSAVTVVNAGDYVNADVKVEVPYEFKGYIWAKLLLEDGTTVCGWFELTDYTMQQYSNNLIYSATKLCRVPDVEGSHKLIAVFGSTTKYDYYPTPTDNDLTMTTYASYGLTINPPAPQLDQRALNSTLSLIWADLHNSSLRTFTVGDEVPVYVVMDIAGNGHYYLKATGPDGVTKTYDLGSIPAGDKLNMLFKYATSKVGTYTITDQLLVLDPATNSLKNITSASLTFTVQKNMVGQAKNSLLTVSAPTSVTIRKPFTVSATVTPGVDGYYLIPVKVNGTQTTFLGPVQAVNGVPKTAATTMKLSNPGSYTVEFGLQYSQDGSHYYDLGITKSTTVKATEPTPDQVVKSWSVSPSATQMIAGQELPITATVNFDPSYGKAEFELQVTAFGSTFTTQPVTASTSPATIKTSMKVPDNVAGDVSVTAELLYQWGG